MESRPLSAREAILRLRNAGLLDESQAHRLDELRRFRNDLVHRPTQVATASIPGQLQELQQLRSRLKWQHTGVAKQYGVRDQEADNRKVTGL